VGGLPDWGTIYEIITKHKTYEQVLTEQFEAEPEKSKKKWWKF
jgi:hypothetical protein